MSTFDDIQWQAKAFDTLSPREVHDLLRLRVDVFIVEQQCIYPEIDGQDPGALHMLGHNVNGTLIAYARLLPPHADGFPHIGRVVVHPEHRGRKLGRRLMEQCHVALRTHYGSSRAALAAQAHLEVFYVNLGYRTVSSEPYMWDGILHVDMQRNDPVISG